jgi:hypothetical protein
MLEYGPVISGVEESSKDERTNFLMVILILSPLFVV